MNERQDDEIRDTTTRMAGIHSNGWTGKRIRYDGWMSDEDAVWDRAGGKAEEVGAKLGQGRRLVAGRLAKGGVEGARGERRGTDKEWEGKAKEGRKERKRGGAHHRGGFCRIRAPPKMAGGRPHLRPGFAARNQECGAPHSHETLPFPISISSLSLLLPLLPLPSSLFSLPSVLCSPPRGLLLSAASVRCESFAYEVGKLARNGIV